MATLRRRKIKNLCIMGSVVFLLVVYVAILSLYQIDMFSVLIQWLNSFLREQQAVIANEEVGWSFLIILLLIMIIQTVIAPIPASIFLIMAGWVYWNNYGLIGFLAALIAAAIGNSIGAFICYYLGSKGGRPLVQRFISEDLINQGEKFFEKHGNAAVMIARLFPFAPADPIAYIAGINHMRFWPDYFVSIVISSVLLSGFYQFLGVYLNPPAVLTLIEIYSLPMTICLFIIVIAVVIRIYWILPRREMKNTLYIDSK